MADYRDHDATIFVSPEDAGPIEAIRREWIPDMASRIAGRVTLAYTQEAPIVAITAFDGAKWVVLMTCGLTGRPTFGFCSGPI